LVTTILSQNTADRNTARAFQTLSKRFDITPEELANADLTAIEEAIKTAGLYKNKARAIRWAAKIVCEKYQGALESILVLPFEEAREVLMQFPGVGPKTADVVLLFSANAPTIPVDTHVNRVAKRLGFAPVKGDYETVRKSLQSLFDPSDYKMVHLLLIGLGREYCRARKPLCSNCPVNMFCPSRES
jgi:endonuclease-3